MSLWELVLRAGKQRRTATYNDADRYFAEEDRKKWEALTQGTAPDGEGDCPLAALETGQDQVCNPRDTEGD